MKCLINETVTMVITTVQNIHIQI